MIALALSRIAVALLCSTRNRRRRIYTNETAAPKWGSTNRMDETWTKERKTFGCDMSRCWKTTAIQNQRRRFDWDLVLCTVERMLSASTYSIVIILWCRRRHVWVWCVCFCRLLPFSTFYCLEHSSWDGERKHSYYTAPHTSLQSNTRHRPIVRSFDSRTRLYPHFHCPFSFEKEIFIFRCFRILRSIHVSVPTVHRCRSDFFSVMSHSTHTPSVMSILRYV